LSDEQRQNLTQRLESQTTGGYKGVSVSSESSLARRMVNNSYITSCLWTVTIAPFASWVKEYGQTSIQEIRANSVGARCLNLINNIWHPLHTAQYLWTRSILSNLILTCMGDRMEMAHSIEGRPPFLDHELAQLANFLPPSVKVRIDPETEQITEKWILREAAKPFVTKEIYERKKHVSINRAFLVDTELTVGRSSGVHGTAHLRDGRSLTQHHVPHYNP
jgi:asparagine synthase (glutamine-hydrolysing)